MAGDASLLTPMMTFRQNRKHTPVYCLWEFLFIKQEIHETRKANNNLSGKEGRKKKIFRKRVGEMRKT